MGDSADKSVTLAIRHYNALHMTGNGRPRLLSYLEPSATLRVESHFVGPFQRNWLYISARAKSRQDDVPSLIPYHPDIVTVDTTEIEADTVRWSCLENVKERRAWNSAVKALVVMSGGIYGGVTPMIERDGDHDIITGSFYLNHIRSEAVRLIPLVSGTVVSASMDGGRSIVVEMTFNPSAILRRGRDDLIGGGWEYAFANNAIANSTIPNFCEDIG